MKAKQTLQETASLSPCQRHITLQTHQGKGTESHAYWKHVENKDIGDPESDHQPNKQKIFWSFMKSLRKDSSGVAPLKENSKMHADPKDKTNIRNRRHKGRYQQSTQYIWSTIPAHGRDHSSRSWSKLLLKINPRKACGPDMISARILKS